MSLDLLKKLELLIIIIIFSRGNKSFIENKYIIFTMVNKLYSKQLQTNQREELIDCRKSEMEIHKPQIQDHSNKVPTNKDFKRSTGLSKVQLFRNHRYASSCMICQYL